MRSIRTFCVYRLLFRYLLLSCSIVLFGLTTTRLNKTTSTTRCLAVTGGGSVGGCSRLSQPSWFLGALHCVIFDYLVSHSLLNKFLGQIRTVLRFSLSTVLLILRVYLKLYCIHVYYYYYCVYYWKHHNKR